MNFDTVLRILQLAITLLQSHSRSQFSSHADFGDTLTELLSVTARAYHDHFGKPIDPFLLKIQEPI